MLPNNSISRPERVAAFIIAAMIVIILVMQTRSLYIFPQPDGARWWGDETGQILELRSELQNGYAHIPPALGSSVALTNGLIRGNSWFAAAIYGIPALIFADVANLVAIGRTVTFVLSLVLIFAMYRMLRGFQVSQALALLAVLLLVTTRSFFYASHAARLDVAAGISVLAFSWYLAFRNDALQQMKWRPTARWYFVYGACMILFATLSIHLLTLLGMLSIYMLWRFDAFRRASAMVPIVGGSLLMLGVLVGIYAITGAPFSVYGPSTSPNQFQSVTAELPILRPFSRSVQIANILERVHGLWLEAPAFLALLIVVTAGTIFRRTSVPENNLIKWISGAAIIILIAWLLLESPARYYFVQVIPLFIVVSVIKLSTWWKSTLASCSVVIAISTALCLFGVMDSISAEHSASAIDQSNHSAIALALDSIQANTKTRGRPIVLAQNPAISMLEHEKSVQLMTAHFVTFPTSNESIPKVLQKLGVRYIVLYAAHDGSIYSADYHALRPVADSLGAIMLRKPGMLFDVDRDYFNAFSAAESSDTLILYKLPTVAQ